MVRPLAYYRTLTSFVKNAMLASYALGRAARVEPDPDQSPSQTPQATSPFLRSEYFNVNRDSRSRFFFIWHRINQMYFCVFEIICECCGWNFSTHNSIFVQWSSSARQTFKMYNATDVRRITLKKYHHPPCQYFRSNLPNPVFTYRSLYGLFELACGSLYPHPFEMFSIQNIWQPQEQL